MDDAIDDDELAHCYRHPDRETALSCIECERPLCVDCAVHAAVGIKCPEHARLSRAARAKVPVARLARGAAAGLVVALVAGWLLLELRGYIGFLSLILAYLAGILVGEATRRASGGFRDHALARIAATAAVVGMLLPVGLLLLQLGDASAAAPQFVVFRVLGAALAGWAAYMRL